MKSLLLMFVLSACALGAGAAGQPHDHGVARLDVVVEPTRVVFVLESPLDNIVGYERAPRTDAERERAKTALARLRNATELFRIDAAAGCTLLKVDLVSAPLQLGNAAAGAAASPAASEHSDLNAVFEFRCKNGTRAGFVEVGLFEAFAALKRIELQVVTPRGQLKATLRKPASRVVLVR